MRALFSASFSVALGSLALFVVGCGSVYETRDVEDTSTTGGDVAVAPTGPPLSYLAAGTKVVARIDIARIRRSPIAPDISSAIRSSPTWQSLAGSSGLDPVQDFDAMLVGGDAVYTDRRVVVLRHPHTEAEVRQRVLAMSVDRASPAAWRDVEGYPVVSWPAPYAVAYSLVLTAEHEAVLAPDDDLARIVAVARDHAQRRTRPDEVVEPQLTGRANEIATVVLDVPLPRRAGYPEPPQRTRVEIDEDASAGTLIAIHSEFVDAAQATAAHSWLGSQRDYWAQQMLVRMAGMNRPLEAARFDLAGNRVDIGASLTLDELRRLLGLMALSQLAQSES